jgi:hypothetical protein
MMARLSRRLFLGSTAGAAAGAALLATQTLPSSAATKPDGTTLPTDNPTDTDDISGVGTMFYVRDAAAGEVVIMHDHHETVVKDRKLVASLARATRRA